MSARGPRYEAQQNGEKFYMGTKPCKRDHLSLRYVDSGSCIECVRLKEKERYYADPEKTKNKIRKKYSILFRDFGF